MYINSFCSIGPAGIIDPYSSTNDLHPLQDARALIVEPDYKDLIPPMQLRRMSKPIRTGVAAAKLCMKSFHDFMPRSIHVGTAYGMLEDSENFLKKILEQEEQMLNPTAFIQSTHNTVSGQIALSIGCMAHNMTFVHRGHSFENALLDASLFLDDISENEQILLGAVEECTNTSYEILKEFNVYNDENVAGEGATFFCLSKNKQAGSLVKIESFEIFKAQSKTSLETIVNSFIEKYSITNDALYIQGQDSNNNITPFRNAVTYERYSGKYATMAAFGIGFGYLNLKESDKESCLILNGFGDYYSLILLSKV